MLSFVNEMNEQNGNLIHSLSFNSKGELTWLASFNSLQLFVEEVLCLSGGKWSSPGGDTKLYQNQDLSIKWYTKSKTLAVRQGQVESKLNWRVWKSFFNDTLNMHAPFRHKRVKGNSVPWITPEIKCMMRNRDYHKKYAIKHGSQLHWQKFQLLRNKVNIEIRNAKSKYFHDKITDCFVMNDPKKTWKLINLLLGKNAKSNNVNELLIGGISVSDPKSIAEELNDYFISIGSKLAAEYENEPSTNVDYLPANYNIDQYSGTFLKFSPILVDSVASTLRDLKACKATGLHHLRQHPPTMQMSSS